MTFNETPATWPLLELLQLLPLVAAIILWKLKNTPAVIIAIIAATSEMVLAVILYRNFDVTQPTMQFGQHASLLGLPYHVAVDGISILFVLLTALLSFLAVFFIIFRELQGTRVLAVMAFIQATLMSQFVTVDLLWFVMMSILEMLSMGYLLYRWATYIDAEPMITRYLQFMSASILLLLIGTFLLGWNYSLHHEGVWSFDLYQLADNVPIGTVTASVIFFALFYGLGIRIPLFPLHGWLPITMQHGNVSVAPVLLLGLKVGVFGLLRFVLPILPETVKYWQNTVVAFAVVGIVYAALLAIRQTNLRRLMAYAVISHTGILTIGLFTLSRNGFEGSIMLAINFGLAISGLMFMIGLVFHRTKTAKLDRLGGLFQYLPLIGIAFLAAGLAIVGMPLTPGFDAVHFVLEATIHQFGGLVTIIAAFGNVVAAGFLLRSFQHAFLSAPSCNTDKWDKSHTRPTEKIMAATIILVIIGISVLSYLWLDLFTHTLDGLTQLYLNIPTEGH
ncbi:MAG: NADH-quinone oxidoreductase subunit M [Cocleimonas sp.]|nr:NADH-quinone oxidoreductase subunit M [Cocleimonas sp.]